MVYRKTKAGKKALAYTKKIHKRTGFQVIGPNAQYFYVQIKANLACDHRIMQKNFNIKGNTNSNKKKRLK